MGFKLSKIVSKVMKPIQKAIDPLLPESVKKLEDKLDAATGNMIWGGTMGKPIDSSGGAAAPTPDTGAAPDTGRLAQDTMDELMQKRMARLGKYFTSPLGVLSNATVAAQKVFS